MQQPWKIHRFLTSFFLYNFFCLCNFLSFWEGNAFPCFSAMKDWVWVWHCDSHGVTFASSSCYWLTPLLSVMRRLWEEKKTCWFVPRIHHYLNIRNDTFSLLNPLPWLYFFLFLEIFLVPSCLSVDTTIASFRSTQFGQFQFLWNISPLSLFVLLRRCPWTLPELSDVKEREERSLFCSKIFSSTDIKIFSSHHIFLTKKEVALQILGLVWLSIRHLINII